MIQKLLLKKIAEKALNNKIIKPETIQKTKEGTKKLLVPKFKIESLDDAKSLLLTFLVYGGIGFVSWKFIINPMWEKYKLDQENKKVFSNPNTRLASLLRQAIIGTGTNVTMVMNAAKEITDWEAVQKAYQNLTKNNLNEDLHGDLNSNQYQRFMAIVNHTTKTHESKSKRGYIVISSKKVRLRSTPDSSISAYSFNSNILDTVNPSLLLGFATGKYKIDSKGVLYHQVRIKYLGAIPSYHKDTYKELKSKMLTFWVGAGAIEMFREFKQMRQYYPSVRIFKGTKDTGLRQALK